MKSLKLLALLAGVALALLPGEKALAQPQDVGGMDPQQIQNLLQQAQNMRQMFQNMDPQQMQNMRQQFQSLDPQQQMDMMQQFQNMDPQQMQERIQQMQGMDPQQMQNAMRQSGNNTLREQMGVTNDADWSLIEEKINAVTKARAAVAADGGMTGLAGMRGRFGGRSGGVPATSGQSSPELQALQRAVDGGAPAAQLKDLVARLRAVHQTRQEALVKAQEDLRSVLTIQQEAVAMLHNLLD